MKLREAREIAGLSQFAVAQRSGISRMRLSLAECGLIELRAVEFKAVQEVLRAEIEQRAARLRNALSTMAPVQVSA